MHSLCLVLGILSVCIGVQCEIVWLKISAENVRDGEVQMQIDFPHSDNLTSLRIDLHKTHGIASPFMKVIVRNGSDSISMLDAPKTCHYRYLDDDVLAVFNDCQDTSWVRYWMAFCQTVDFKHMQFKRGYLQTSNITMEIQPLRHRIDGATHIGYNEQIPTIETQRIGRHSRRKRSPTPNVRPTIELGVFFDAAAYRVFAPHYDDDPERLRDMILAYVNAVQSLYHHDSLGTRIDLVVVYMELMQRQPAEMPHHQGERSRLLDSFCAYQGTLNPTGDEAETHWDMAVYISA